MSSVNPRSLSLPSHPATPPLLPDARMDPETNLIPSSPTNSSLSSSDIDTESTGSFFIDRSATLGSLMGFSFPEIPARPGRPPLGRQPDGCSGANSGSRKQEARGRRSRRRGSAWWWLCRDEVRPTSLEEFLKAERQIGVAEADFITGREENEAFGGGGRLFENGRVLPPRPAAGTSSSVVEGRQRRGGMAPGGAIGRLPVVFAGICSGG